ncbi:LOB domain-containing protein 39 [Ananas comosus]|uniref:LOB domain-containing protein 39 n=2 Tax=Ananas comosus TaxID=4615 RepID=A0A199VI36_ANACO|nr:LOB domain-containing protein 39 [Ananas comosus]CAD1837851.1 unnamed protein product [Ananas comosus var. bracteatus]
MSCNGCRVLRKGCSEACVLRPCLQWIESAEAQGHATVFVAKFFGRAGLMSFISAVPEPQRPALFQSLLFEACGRTINPVNGAVGLLWTGNWHLCQAAVETVLRGGSLRPLPDLDGLCAAAAAAAADDDGGGLYARPRGGGASTFSAVKRLKSSLEDSPPPFPLPTTTCDLNLCLSPRISGAAAAAAAAGDDDEDPRRRRRPTTPSMTSEGSVTTSGDSSGRRQPHLLNLFL